MLSFNGSVASQHQTTLTFLDFNEFGEEKLAMAWEPSCCEASLQDSPPFLLGSHPAERSLIGELSESSSLRRWRRSGKLSQSVFFWYTSVELQIPSIVLEGESLAID